MPTKWEKEQAQAKNLGYKSAWEMRKASHKAKHQGYMPTALEEPATPLLDRLAGCNGPVKHIMKEGVWAHLR